MAFDTEKEPGDELEDYGNELSSDYREEEGGAGEGEEIEEEVSYEREETTVTEGPSVVTPKPAPAVTPPAKPAPAIKKAARKPKTKRPTAKKGRRKAVARRPARKKGKSKGKPRSKPRKKTRRR